MTRNGIRPPSVAGTFYPEDPSSLTHVITTHCHAAPAAPHPIRAIIAPHAGFDYSGPTAGHIYGALAAQPNTYSDIVIVGPSHHVRFEGIAMDSHEKWQTPIDQHQISPALSDIAARQQEIIALNAAHTPEHAIETQLPFLTHALPNHSILPLTLGHCSSRAVTTVMEHLLRNDILLIISSDLSHFHDYTTAKKMDQETAQHILDLTPTPLTGQDACGFQAINAFLPLARTLHLEPACLDLRNSGDTAGSRNRVVGYGAFAFYET